MTDIVVFFIILCAGVLAWGFRRPLIYIRDETHYLDHDEIAAKLKAGRHYRRLRRLGLIEPEEDTRPAERQQRGADKARCSGCWQNLSSCTICGTSICLNCRKVRCEHV